MKEYSEGILVNTTSKEESSPIIKSDERTLEIVAKIANELDKNIQVTYDVPSKYQDGKVPILDLKANINEEGKIEYVFYRKSISSRKVTDKFSAMSVKQKCNILTQQCFMRLHNTSESVDTETKVNLLNDFMEDLANAGYEENERYNILTGAFKTDEKLKTKEKQGLRPYYRGSDYIENKNTNKNEKLRKRNNWYKKKNNKFKTVMFVDPTPGDKLLKNFKITEEKFKISDDIRIKFVSKSGNKLKHIFSKRNPFQKACGANDCHPCDPSGDDNLVFPNCRSNNISYSATCTLCEKEGRNKTYIGETCRNLYMRSKEHYAAFKHDNEKSFMFKHMNAEHADSNENVNFKWKILRKFMKPLQRQIYEANTISNMPDNVLLNSKQEFNHMNTKKICMKSSLEKHFQCNNCGGKFPTKNHFEQFYESIKCSSCQYEAIGKMTSNIMTRTSTQQESETN